MPFIVAIKPAGEPPSYYMLDPKQDGVNIILLTPSRDKATRFAEDEADSLAANHNRYTGEPEAVVEGAKP